MFLLHIMRDAEHCRYEFNDEKQARLAFDEKKRVEGGNIVACFLYSASDGLLEYSINRPKE